MENHEGIGYRPFFPVEGQAVDDFYECALQARNVDDFVYNELDNLSDFAEGLFGAMSSLGEIYQPIDENKDGEMSQEQFNFFAGVVVGYYVLNNQAEKNGISLPEITEEFANSFKASRYEEYLIMQEYSDDDFDQNFYVISRIKNFEKLEPEFYKKIHPLGFFAENPHAFYFGVAESYAILRDAYEAEQLKNRLGL